MNHIKINTRKFISLILSRIHVLILFISSVSLFFVFLELINIDAIVYTNQIGFISNLFQIAVFLSMIYIILFLPSYPLFFIIFKEKSFNFLEKLGLTIILNMSFYILTGYFGFFIGIPITGIYFFFAVAIFYFSFIGYIVYFEMKERKFSIFQHKIEESFSIYNSLKELIVKNVNTILLLIFIALICILNVERFSYWYGTDAMFHAYMIRTITEINYLPLNQYFGAVGIHIFGAVINFFSGVNILLIPRYFLFYTFFVSTLLVYNFLKKIFNNKNLALFGVFILEFSSIGFSNMMYQFWPTALSTLQCLTILFLLYIRFQSFTKKDRPKMEEIYLDIYFYYILIIIIAISAIFTHSVITPILLISFLLIYLVYFLEDFKRGFDFVVLCILCGMYLFFSSFNIFSNFYFLFKGIPWYIYPIAIIGSILVIFLFRKTIKFNYTPGRFSEAITGKTHKKLKRFEDKFLFPFVFLLTSVFTTGFIIFNYLILDIYFSKIIIGLEVVILIVFSLWGYLYFQLKPKGRLLILWLFSIILLFMASFIVDIFRGESFLSGRILILLSPVIVFGFIAYIYKIIKLNLLGSLQVKLLIFLFIAFSFFSHFYDELTDLDGIEYNLTRREVISIQWLTIHTSNKEIIFTEFGMNYVFMYFDYPFDEKNTSFNGLYMHYFIPIYEDYFHPDNHFNETTGANILQEIKNNYNSNFYLMLDDNYLALREGVIIDRLTVAEMEAYYNLNYLNKICSSKSEYGVEVPYYWVI